MENEKLDSFEKIENKFKELETTINILNDRIKLLEGEGGD